MIYKTLFIVSYLAAFTQAQNLTEAQITAVVDRLAEAAQKRYVITLPFRDRFLLCVQLGTGLQS